MENPFEAFAEGLRPYPPHLPHAPLMPPALIAEYAPFYSCLLETTAPTEEPCVHLLAEPDRIVWVLDIHDERTNDWLPTVLAAAGLDVAELEKETFDLGSHGTGTGPDRFPEYLFKRHQVGRPFWLIAEPQKLRYVVPDNFVGRVILADRPWTSSPFDDVPDDWSR